MNGKTAKRLRRLAEEKGVSFKRVKKRFKKLDRIVKSIILNNR